MIYCRCGHQPNEHKHGICCDAHCPCVCYAAAKFSTQEGAATWSRAKRRGFTTYIHSDISSGEWYLAADIFGAMAAVHPDGRLQEFRFMPSRASA